MTRLRVIPGSRGLPTTVVIRQSTLDDLVDEVTALEAEAIDLTDRALPLARQLALIATVHGPTWSAIARELIGILERQQRRHGHGAAA